MVASVRMRSTERPMARAASALSPAIRRMSPQRVFLRPHSSTIARAMPMKNIGLMSKAERIAGFSLQLPSGSPGSIAARGSMNGLPR